MAVPGAESDDLPFFDSFESLPGFEPALATARPRPRAVRSTGASADSPGKLSDSPGIHLCQLPVTPPEEPPLLPNDSEKARCNRNEGGDCPPGVTCSGPKRPLTRDATDLELNNDQRWDNPSRTPGERNLLQERVHHYPHFVAQQTERRDELTVPRRGEVANNEQDQGFLLPVNNREPTLQDNAFMNASHIPQSHILYPENSSLQHSSAAHPNGLPNGRSNGVPTTSDLSGEIMAQASSSGAELICDAESDAVSAKEQSVPRKYSVVYDVLYADRSPEAEISIVKIATEVIGSVKQGSDVTNVNLPASVLDPVSSLEKGMKSMQRGELIQAVCNSVEPLDRFLAVLRFYFSGLSKERFGKKPYNPILGEVFRSCFMHENGGGYTVLVAEQVSHHPPITALHLCNETLGFKMNSFTAPEPRFWGNSVEVKLRGVNRITLEKWDNEEYELTRPFIHMSGFLAGRHRLEFVGTTSVVCLKTGVSAEIEFKSKGMLGRGELNGIHGRVYNTASGKTLYTIVGTWDGILTATNASTGEDHVLFDYGLVVAEHSMIAILPPLDEREETFSSSVWAECSEAIWKSDSVAANIAKRKVEERQRQLRKERTGLGNAWRHIYFEQRKDGKDGYVLREGLRNLLGPDVVLSAEDQATMKQLRRTLANRETDQKSDRPSLRTARSKKS
jgi:oxysterol-binding protein-related protein 8